MAQNNSYIGRKYGILTVESLDRRENIEGTFFYYFKCKCECGKERIIERCQLRFLKSCGCMRNKLIGLSKIKHGDVGSKEWNTWCRLKSRCNREGDPAYKDYGGRGIKVCDRWLESYENFLLDMGRAPTPRHSIDRRDNDKGYSPDNCYWATAKMQTNNTRHNIFIEFLGQKKTLSQWCDFFGLKYKRTHYRFKYSKLPLDVVFSKKRLHMVFLFLLSHTALSQQYCLPIETARLVIEDAVKSRIKDTIIQKQQDRIASDSLYMIQMQRNFEQRIEDLKLITKNQVEINRQKDKVIDLKNQELRKYRRERRIGIGILGVLAIIVIL